MRVFEAVCDCGATARGVTRTEARRCLRDHECARNQQCGLCRLWFWVLVDDGNLCVGCDSRVADWYAVTDLAEAS
jgi:hypothetical protein